MTAGNIRLIQTDVAVFSRTDKVSPIGQNGLHRRLACLADR
jgi:hypothetical protein